MEVKHGLYEHGVYSTAPGNTGNLLKFNWSSWKIAKCWQQSWDSCSPSKLVGCHSDERWSELIITCSEIVHTLLVVVILLIKL